MTLWLRPSPICPLSWNLLTFPACLCLSPSSAPPDYGCARQSKEQEQEQKQEVSGIGIAVGGMDVYAAVAGTGVGAAHETNVLSHSTTNTVRTRRFFVILARSIALQTSANTLSQGRILSTVFRTSLGR